MIEAEVKYRVTQPERSGQRLRAFAVARSLVYHDQYYLHKTLDFSALDAELRIRAISERDGPTRTILTFKRDIADAATASKSEYEVELVDSQSSMRTLLEAMGFRCYIEFRKYCEHYEFDIDGRSVAATIVRLDESDEVFAEIESLVSGQDQVEPEIEWLKSFAQRVGLEDSDRTTDTYEGLVATARRGD